VLNPPDRVIGAGARRCPAPDVRD